MPNRALPLVASLTLAAVAGCCFLTPARAQNPQYTQEVVASRVWTNEDTDQLRAEAPITTFNPSAEPAAPVQTIAPFAPRPIRALDAAWYAEQAALLQAELDARRSALAKYTQAIQDAKDRQHMTSGMALARETIAATPESGVEILQARVAEIQNRLEELGELARQNGIAPGVLRG